MSQADSYLADLVGAFGDPIAENPTGVMQEAAFRALDLNWRYLTIEVHAADLAAAVAGMRAMNFRGINLTIPHKVEVLCHLDEIAPDAGLIGAVNTIRRDGDRLVGENTDGKGFLRSLQAVPIDPRGRRVVILGAGGAAKAIAVELALAGASYITVVNRSVERGRALADGLASTMGTAADFQPWTSNHCVPDGTEILVNATSIGLFPESAADSLPGHGGGAGRHHTRRVGHARLPGRHRLHDVDRSRSADGRDAPGTARGVRLMGRAARTGGCAGCPV